MSTLDALGAEHQQLRKAVPELRRAARRTEGALAAAFREAMQIVDAQREAGVSLEDRLRGLDQVLRAVWPQTRAWHYLCDRCDDHGLQIAECQGDATCGRTRPHLAHGFGTPCWCSRGDRFKAQPKPGPEDFTQAGRSKSMSRVGRR